MTPLNQSEIKEIADQMDCSMRCYRNIKTNKLLFFPDALDFDDDPDDFWKEEIDELENHIDNYREIHKPESRESFKMMREFANSDLIGKKFQEKLLIVLELKKPFANFKISIDNSDFIEEWYSFKNIWMQKWIKDELESDLEGE
jgi:hypothetical protein